MRLAATFIALMAVSLVSLITGWHKPVGLVAISLIVIILGWVIVFTKVK